MDRAGRFPWPRGRHYWETPRRLRMQPRTASRVTPIHTDGVVPDLMAFVLCLS